MWSTLKCGGRQFSLSLSFKISHVARLCDVGLPPCS